MRKCKNFRGNNFASCSKFAKFAKLKCYTVYSLNLPFLGAPGDTATIVQCKHRIYTIDVQVYSTKCAEKPGTSAVKARVD